MTLFIENPKNATRKLLELSNELSNVSGYKINIQKFATVHTLTLNSQKKKLKKQSHLPLHQKQ